MHIQYCYCPGKGLWQCTPLCHFFFQECLFLSAVYITTTIFCNSPFEKLAQVWEERIKLGHREPRSRDHWSQFTIELHWIYMTAKGNQGRVDDDWKALKEMLYRQFDSVSTRQRRAKPIASPQVQCYSLDLLFWQHSDKLKITPFWIQSMFLIVLQPFWDRSN